MKYIRKIIYYLLFFRELQLRILVNDRIFIDDQYYILYFIIFFILYEGFKMLKIGYLR